MNILKLIGILIFSVLIVGCNSIPTTQISAFAESTANVTEKVDTIFTEYNEQFILAQLTSVAGQYQGETESMLTLDIIREIKPSTLVENKKSYAIYQANRALSAYAKALQSLSNAGSKSEMDTASANLYSSIIDINSHYKNITNDTNPPFEKDKVGVIASIISSIGQVFAEQKKRQALKDIIIEANPYVSTLCDAMVLYLNEAKFGEVIATSREQTLEEFVLNYDKVVRSAAKPGLAQRMVMITGLTDMMVQRDNAHLITAKAIKAIGAVKSGHGTITNAVQQDVFTSEAIFKAITNLKDIDNNYNDFRSVLLECDAVKFVAVDGQLKCKNNG